MIGLGTGVSSLAFRPRPNRKAFYFAANGNGNGKSKTSPALWSAANFGDAVDSGRNIFMRAPAVTPSPDADRRPDEFWELPGGWEILKGVSISSYGHPDNPDGHATFCGDVRPGWLKPATRQVTNVTTGDWLDGSTLKVGGLGFIPKAPGIMLKDINYRRLGTAVKMSQSGAHGLIIDGGASYNIQRFLDQPINVRASATATFTANPANGNSITIGTFEIFFGTHVPIGDTPLDTANNFRTFVNENYKALGVQVTAVTAINSNTAWRATITSNLLGSDGNGTKNLIRTGTAITLSGSNLTGGSTITNNNGLVRNVSGIGFTKAWFRTCGNSSNWVFQNLNGDSAWMDGDNFARVWYGGDRANIVKLYDCVGGNIVDTNETYDNGDIFNTDDGVDDIEFWRCGGVSSSDGGFDLKGTRLKLYDCFGRQCKRIFRVWGGVTIIGGESEAPTNSGSTTHEYGNGSAFIFGRGNFPTTITGTDPYDGAGATRFKADLYVEDHHFIGDGDLADAGTGRQASLFALMEAAGGVARIVNSWRTNSLTSGSKLALTAANAGAMIVDANAKFMIYNGEKSAVNTAITTPAVHTAVENSPVSIPLIASGLGTEPFELCTWDLDLFNPLVENKSITLSSFAKHNPNLLLTAPAYPGSVSVTVYCVDVLKNIYSRTITVNTTESLDTNPPVIAANGPVIASHTASSFDYDYPGATRLNNDICWVNVESNVAGVDHPSIPGFTLDPDLTSSYTLSTVTYKVWKLYRRLDGTEGTKFTVSFWSDAGANPSDPGTVASTPDAVGNTTAHAVKATIVRFARRTGKPYEGAAVSNIAAPTNSTAPYVTGGTTLTPTVGVRSASCITTGKNRLVFTSVTAFNDIVLSVHSSTPEWTFNDSQFTQEGSDMTFASATQAVANAVASPGVPGAIMTWNAAGVRPACSTATVAFIPIQEPA